MLPGTLYPKKTYGRSLFIGEFKLNSANIANAEISETKAAPVTEKSLEKGEANSATAVSLAPADGESDPVRVAQKTLTYREDSNDKTGKEEDVKVVWKKSANPSTATTKSKKLLTTKAFFTPAEIVGKDSDTEPQVKVVDLPVLKEESDTEANKANKKPKLQFLSSQQITGKKTSTHKAPKLSPRTKNLPKIAPHSPKPTIHETAKKVDDNNLPPIEINDQNQSRDTEKDLIEDKESKDQPVTTKFPLSPEIPVTSEDPQVKSEYSQVKSEEPQVKTESPPSPSEDTIKEEDRDSEENKSSIQEETESVTSKSPREIVIKPSELAAYSEKFIVDDKNPESVLEPDVVADIKRGLAEKGIIVLPPSLTPEPQTLSQLQEEDDEAVSKGTLSELEQNLESTLDKFDKREGFKTNKSFEIRRLQAKAERRKEEKRRAIFGSRYHRLKSKGEPIHNMAAPDVTSKTLKSVLKPPTPPTGEDNTKSSSPANGKSRSMVRIRDPEFDYQEYTDVELESDEMDSNRANTSLSYSDLTTHSDSSSDLSTMSTTTVDAFDRELSSDDTSSEDSDIHRLYDEIDNLSPSRQGYNEDNRRENFSRESRRSRAQSGTSMVTKRSSLHLNPDPNYTQNPHFVKSFQDRPMHLFDSMRQEKRSRHKTRDPLNQFNVEGTSFNEENETGRLHSRHKKHKRQAKNDNKHAEKSVRSTNMAFGPSVFPILQLPNNGSANYTRKEWKKRVAKFFETSYAARNSSNKTSNKDVEGQHENAEITNKCCQRLYNFLDCSQKSLLSHVLWIMIPTVLISSGLLFIVLVTTRVFEIEAESLADVNSNLTRTISENTKTKSVWSGT